MIKTKYYTEEDRPLLILALDSEKFRITQPVYEAAIPRGAVNHLGRWPAHVSAAFIAGCLVFTTFVLLGIIAVILTIPLGEKCRTPRNIETTSYLPNVYFIKHENRTWNTKELCYIETTARTYKNLSIYLINLLDDNENFYNHENFSREVLNLLETENEAKENGELPISVEIFNQDNESMIGRQESVEKRSRKKLSAFNANIKNIEVPIQRFFNGSRLTKVCNQLNENMIEIAAKAYVLWNFPGVALDPKMYKDFEFFEEYLYKKVDGENNCGKDSIAAIELNGNIQASSVPCQAFLDHLIRQISTNELSDQQDTLKKAIGDFCPRSSQCRGVRLLDLHLIPKTEVFEERLDCPTIISAIGV